MSVGNSGAVNYVFSLAKFGRSSETFAPCPLEAFQRMCWITLLVHHFLIAVNYPSCILVDAEHHD